MLTGKIGTTEGGKFCICQIIVSDMGIFIRNSNKFSKSAVTAMPNIVDIGKTIAVMVIDAEINDHTLSDPVCRDAGPDRSDYSDRIRALDSGKRQRLLRCASSP